MVDIFSSEKRSDVMRHIHSKNTAPELKIRKALHCLGFRYRLHVKDMPGCPDMVLPKYKAAIQIRGCFWHLHGCQRSNIPKSNKQYWEKKLGRNKDRDRQNDLILSRAGWHLIIVWECEVRSGEALKQTINRILQEIEPGL